MEFKWRDLLDKLSPFKDAIGQDAPALTLRVGLSRKMADRLTKLADSTSGDKAQVVRDALRLYEYVLGHTNDGASFYMQPKGSDDLVQITPMVIEKPAPHLRIVPKQ